MGYTQRVFCKASTVPPLRDIFAWTAKQGYPLTLDPIDAESLELTALDWGDAPVALHYQKPAYPLRSEHLPFLAEMLWKASPTPTPLPSNARVYQNIDDLLKSFNKSKQAPASPASELTDEAAQRFVEEIEEFTEAVMEAECFEKWQVLQHLRETNYMVICQRPMSGFDERGFRAMRQFLDYFVQHCNGLLHIDDEGFYLGERLILEIE